MNTLEQAKEGERKAWRRYNLTLQRTADEIAELYHQQDVARKEWNAAYDLKNRLLKEGGKE